jgi:hypothetical protein
MASDGLIKDEDFAFVVMACGYQWSVYRFVTKGKRGMLAFTKSEEATPEHPEGQWVIGMLKEGELTPSEVALELEHGQALEDRLREKGLVT